MLNFIRKMLNRFSRFRDPKLPKAAPSVAEAILPLDADTYAITPAQLMEMYEGDTRFVLLDVREEWEYRMVHLEGATWIPLGELPKRCTELNPACEIVVYCHWGMRSLDAAFLLQQLGFKSVKSLIGGIDRWAQEIDTEIVRY